MNQTVAVIGAGNGGTAIAAYMASLGANVNLCDLFPDYLKGIGEKGWIQLTTDGHTSRQYLHMVTTDLARAIKQVSLIMVVTPSFTHPMIAKACCDHLKDGQIIVLNPGRTGGALEFLHIVRSGGCQKDILVAEAQTLIYSCRKKGVNAVEIYGVKRQVDVGVLPASRTREVIQALAPYYPQFLPAKNCMQTSLSNIGALFHPTPVLLNTGRIEGGCDFKYYWDGISPSVANLIQALDRERMAVARAYHTEVLSASEWLLQSYDTKGENLYQLIQNNQAYRDIDAPKSLQARYLTEDVPMSLVPIAALGRLAGLTTPNIDAVITLACAVCGTDFWSQGRSLHNMGLEGMTVEQVEHYFETGVRKES